MLLGGGAYNEILSQLEAPCTPPLMENFAQENCIFILRCFKGPFQDVPGGEVPPVRSNILDWLHLVLTQSCDLMTISNRTFIKAYKYTLYFFQTYILTRGCPP